MADVATPTTTDLDEAKDEIERLKKHGAQLQTSLQQINEAFNALLKTGASVDPDAASSVDPDAARRQEAREESVGHYANYSEYNKLLRSWFVAFGVGGIALFFTRPELLTGVTPWLEWSIVGAFLVGAAGQVAIAFINKVASYRNYDYYYRVANTEPGEEMPDQTTVESWWETVADMFGLDILADWISVICFSWVIGTLLFRAVIAAPKAGLFI